MPNKNRGDRDLKKLVRARMKITGEKYTTARAQLLKERELARQAPKREPMP